MAEFEHKALRRPFPWGPIVAVHQIGNHKIVEHHPHMFKDGCGTGKYDMSRTHFTCIFERQAYDRYEGATTLDQALIVCIGAANGTSGAVPYAAQILGVA